VAVSGVVQDDYTESELVREVINVVFNLT
jgi:hypothetical protein